MTDDNNHGAPRGPRKPSRKRTSSEPRKPSEPRKSFDRGGWQKRSGGSDTRGPRDDRRSQDEGRSPAPRKPVDRGGWQKRSGGSDTRGPRDERRSQDEDRSSVPRKSIDRGGWQKRSGGSDTRGPRDERHGRAGREDRREGASRPQNKPWGRPRTVHAPGSFAAFFDAMLRSGTRAAGRSPRGGAEQDAHKRAPERGACLDADGRLCTVCHASRHPYDQEAGLRQEALAQFWHEHDLAPFARPLVRTGSGRWYRIVSKRKAWQPQRGAARLGLIDPAGGPALEVGRCAIEAPEHSAIYQTISEALHASSVRPLGDELRHAVIKGNMEEFTVILSVGMIDPGVMRAATALSKILTRTHTAIKGIFLFEDETDGRYYLGTRDADAVPTFRKLFGASDIFHRIAGRPYLHHPLAFTQVSEDGAERLVQAATTFLNPDPKAMFYDFYCGYGLFTLAIGHAIRGAVGVELSHHSIKSAVANAKRQHADNVRFMRADISEETVLRVMARSGENDVVLLDPPRGGVEQGVIEAIAERRPLRVAHVFCAIDRIPHDLGRWTSSGYAIKTIIPFDNFAGTDEVEVFVGLERARMMDDPR